MSGGKTSGITMEQARAVYPGMGLDQLVDTLGKPDHTLREDLLNRVNVSSGGVGALSWDMVGGQTLTVDISTSDNVLDLKID